MNRNIQITIASIIISIVIIVIGYYSISFEQQKMSYLPNAVIERMDDGEEMIAIGCEKSYPDLCIQKGDITLTCENIIERSFNVTHDDPNNLDPDGNGIGCEN